MRIVPTRIPDVMLIEPVVHGDARGFFMETWRESVFQSLGIEARFVQDNHSRSVRHTLRGLHYQVHEPQGKLVRVIAGEVFDVAVDLRRSSGTFGQWVGATLTSENHQQMWIPPGFAHGFLVLSDSADVVYKCTDYFVAEHDRTVRWDDSELGITWPLAGGTRPLLSEKDRSARGLSEAELYP